MSSTLPITDKLSATPLFDIRHQEVAIAYREGLLEQLHHQAHLVPVSSLVTCLQRSVARSVFDGKHQEAARDFVGYHFGRCHGTVITRTGGYRCDVATLAALDTDGARRGYLAGRH